MLKWCMVALLAAWLTLLLPPAQPLAAAGVNLTASAGYEGQGRQGSWLPIRVTLTNDGPDQTVTVRVRRGGDGNLLRASQSVELPTNTRKQVVVPLLSDGLSSSFLIQALAGEQVLSETRLEVTPLPASRRLTGIVTSTPEAAARVIAGLSARDLIGQPVRLSLAELPTHAPLLSAFDVLIINGVSTRSLSPEQLSALQGWVVAGGSLVLGGGGNAAAVLEGLGEIAPVQLTGPATTVARLPGLEEFTKIRVEAAGPFVLASARAQPEATVLARQEGQPLVTTRALGAGRVAFVALDLGSEPFLGWSGATPLWGHLAWPTVLANTSAGRLVDLGVQLRGALGTGTLLDLPSIGQLALLLLAYVVTIGPLNYLVLRRLDRREWAWLTTPAITLLFTGGLFLIGADARGNQVVVNSINIVTSTDGVSGAAVTSYTSVFSPMRANQTLRLPAGTLVSGLPEISRGNQQPGLDLWYGGATEIRDLPFATGELKTFASQAPLSAGPVVATLRLEGGRVVGTVTNTSGVALADAYLLRGRRVLPLGTIEPGGSATVSWTIPTDALSQGAALASQLNPRRANDTRPDLDWDWMARGQLISFLFESGANSTLSPGLQVVAWQTAAPLSPIATSGRSRSQTLTLIHHRLNLNMEGQ